MTQEEAIDGNKLIAEFMRWKFKQYSDSFSRWYDPQGIEYTHVIYHTSWDWLMPVVEKIDKVHFSDFNNVNLWVLEEEKRKVLELPIRTKIHKVWLAVVEFIKFYNHHK